MSISWRDKIMEKYVKYCPYCNKYQPSSFDDCGFCFRKLWLLSDWENTDEEEKEDWLKYPMPAKDTSKVDLETLQKIQDEATSYDADVKAEKQEALEEEQRKSEEAAKSAYIPRCPVCGSPDLQKISATSKVLDVAIWGWASKKPGKQFKCGNCGYEF